MCKMSIRSVLKVYEAMLGAVTCSLILQGLPQHYRLRMCNKIGDATTTHYCKHCTSATIPGVSSDQNHKKKKTSHPKADRQVACALLNASSP